MRKSIVAALAVGSIFGVITTSSVADPRDRPHVHVGGGLSHEPHLMILQVLYKDIVYDSSSQDKNTTSLDVYTLDPPEPKSPVMVWVHGGGLRVGDKLSSKDLDPKPEYFNSKLGYILVSVNYRLLPEGRYPTNVQDVANALAWVHSNIASYGGDPEQIFLMGHSAGAGLVAQVATDEAFLEKAGKNLAILKGVIANEGSRYDLTAPGTDAKGTEAAYGPDWRNASPVAHVAKGKHIPPFLLIHVNHGTGISAGSGEQARIFSGALRAAGVRADVLPVDHVEHFGANERLGEPGDVITATVEGFLSSLATSRRPIGWKPGKPLG